MRNSRNGGLIFIENSLRAPPCNSTYKIYSTYQVYLLRSQFNNFQFKFSIISGQNFFGRPGTAPVRPNNGGIMSPQSFIKNYKSGTIPSDDPGMNHQKLIHLNHIFEIFRQVICALTKITTRKFRLLKIFA